MTDPASVATLLDRLLTDICTAQVSAAEACTLLAPYTVPASDGPGAHRSENDLARTRLHAASQTLRMAADLAEQASASIPLGPATSTAAAGSTHVPLPVDATRAHSADPSAETVDVASVDSILFGDLVADDPIDSGRGATGGTARSTADQCNEILESVIRKELSIANAKVALAGLAVTSSDGQTANVDSNAGREAIQNTRMVLDAMEESEHGPDLLSSRR